MEGLVGLLMMIEAKSTFVHLPYNGQNHAAIYAQAEQQESCEALIKSLLPKYNLFNQVAETTARYPYTTKEGNLIVPYQKDYVIKLFNSAATSHAVRHLTGKEAEQFLKNEKYDIVEIHDIVGTPLKPRMSALLYRGENRTYVMFNVGNPVEFRGKKGNVFCEDSWDLKYIGEAAISILSKALKKQPIQPTPPKKRQPYRST